MRAEQIVLPVLRRVAASSRGQRLLDRALAPINLFSPAYATDPYPMYEALRAQGSIIRHRAMRVWVVVSFDLAEEVLRSSANSVDRSFLMDVVRPWSQLDAAQRSMFTESMLLSDPPRHTRLRRLVSRAFTPRTVARVEPRVDDLANTMVRRLREAGGGDLVTEMFAPLPIYVISELLGIPESDWVAVKGWSDYLARFIDPVQAFDPIEMDRVLTEVSEAIDGWAAHRRRDPADDLLGALVTVEDAGDRLSRTELRSMVMLLMVAGHETTSGFLGNALVALDDNPDQRRLVATNPALVPNAVEELLRFDSPVQNTDRILTEDIELGGEHLRAGETVAVMIGGANRDPTRFADANRLDLDRADPRSISFGFGIHHCVGAALARMESRAVLRAMLPILETMALDREAIRWKQSMTLRGPISLPMTIEG